jgi:putative methionine-R-sulfoxide reductase with GAF domain
MLVHHEGYTSSLYVVADSIAPGKQRYRRTSFKGLVGQVVGDGRPIRASNVKKLDRYMSAVPSTEAELIVPICSPDGAPVGVLNSESDSSGHFTHGMEIRSEALALAIGSLLPEVHWSSVQPVSTLPQLK